MIRCHSISHTGSHYTHRGGGTYCIMYLFCRARNSAWRVCECENLSICVSLPPSTPISASNPQCMHPSPEWLSVDTAADYGATLYKGMCTTRPVADVATTALDHETPQLHFAWRLHCRRIRDAQRQLARQSSSRLSAWSAAVSSLVVCQAYIRCACTSPQGHIPSPCQTCRARSASTRPTIPMRLCFLAERTAPP